MNRTVVITGASDGIGKAAAAALAANHDEVIIIGRDVAKTTAVARELKVPCYTADFASLDQVRKLALQLAELPQIDILINNAGGVQRQRQLTVDGYEQTFQVNYLAPFMLTNLLLPKLIASQAIIINTSSAANWTGHVDLEDLNNAKHYKNFKAYATSKLENIIFTRTLAAKYTEKGISTAAFHPGVIASNFAADASPLLRLVYHSPLRRLLRMQTVEEGADTLLWLVDEANRRAWHTGNYYANRRSARVNSQAHDLDLADQLWVKSLQMTNLKGIA